MLSEYAFISAIPDFHASYTQKAMEEKITCARVDERDEVDIPKLAGAEGTAARIVRPLCVDLDGTLVKSDTLWDSLFVLIRRKPLLLGSIPAQILQGKASFKAFVASEASLDVTRLPYNRSLLDYLKAESVYRKLYLATGADRALAERVGAHLGLFEGVLASDGTTNLTGSHKLERLQKQFGEKGFDYIGNSVTDLPLLVASGNAMVANADKSLLIQLRRGNVKVLQHFQDRSSHWKAMIRAARVHQWAKNTLVFLPLLLAHTFSGSAIVEAFLAFFCFSFCASATYILNDLLDLESDRTHPIKRFRPFANGDLSVASGLATVAVLLLLALAGLTQLNWNFTFWIFLYLLITNLYSFVLKRIALVDVFVLSGLYTLRMLAGGAATSTPISHWLAGLSTFLFLSLAMVKRYSELQNLRARGSLPSNGRGYLLADTDQLRSFGTASAYSAVVVFSVYITGREAAVLYRHPGWMWLIAPLMLFWLNRIWLLASRGEMSEDPVVFAVTDRLSILIGVAVLVVALIAM